MCNKITIYPPNTSPVHEHRFEIATLLGLENVKTTSIVNESTKLPCKRRYLEHEYKVTITTTPTRQISHIICINSTFGWGLKTLHDKNF